MFPTLTIGIACRQGAREPVPFRQDGINDETGSAEAGRGCRDGTGSRRRMSDDADSSGGMRNFCAGLPDHRARHHQALRYGGVQGSVIRWL